MSATLPDSPAGIPSVFKEEIQDESLEFADSDVATNSAAVLTAIAQTDVGEDDLRDPPSGRHFVKLEVDPAQGQSGPYPVELGVRVTGTVIGKAPASESTPSPLSGGSGGGDGTSDLVLAIGGAGGILLGVFAGGAAAGLGRRRPG